MPLESLSQPFNPDEPGRKLREVQVEQEPEKESWALKRFEEVKNVFYKDGKWNTVLDRDGTTFQEVEAGEVTTMILQILENELDIPPQESTLQGVQIDTAGTSAWHIMREGDAEKQKQSWKQHVAGEFAFDGHNGSIYTKDFKIKLTEMGVATVLFQNSYFDPEETRPMLDKFIEKVEQAHMNDDEYDKFHVDLQCLVTLALSSYDKPRAAEYFKKHVRSTQYDAEKKLWQSKNTLGRYYLEDQLLTLLIGIRLHLNEEDNISTHTREIPEERNF